jgi:DNA-binding protein H-NS
MANVNLDKLNLDKMPLKDLVELELKLKRAIGAARERERSDIKDQALALISEAGFTVTELFGTGGRVSTKGRTVAAKYANPDDRTQTWTGRGRKPNWVVTKLKNGSKMEDFAI